MQKLSNRSHEALMLPASNLRLLREEGPLVFTRGRGVFTFDEKGRDYIETVSTFYCVSLGFSDEELIEAVTSQLRTLPMYPSGMHRTIPVVIELAERLAGSTDIPNAHVLFATTGSEANDALVKFLWYRNRASGRPERRKIISRRDSFHGATALTAALGGNALLLEAFGVARDDCLYVSHPRWPDEAHPGEDEDAYTDRLVAELRQTIEDADPKSVGAFLAEPISVSSGMYPPPRGYFQKVKVLLDEYGIYLFADEIVTGFGRTGRMWGSDALGISPDCITSAKGLSSGYQPISAIIMSDEFYGGLERGSGVNGVFSHATTYGAHPAAAAVALKVFDIFERRNVLEHVERMSGVWANHLARLEAHPLVCRTRHYGLLGAVQLANPRQVTSGAAAPSMFARGGLGWAAYYAGLTAGVVVRPLSDCFVMAPPLIIDEGEIDELFRRLTLALDHVLAELGTE
jgi:4-aminobutyrate--pyruvate transaminase